MHLEKHSIHFTLERNFALSFIQKHIYTRKIKVALPTPTPMEAPFSYQISDNVMGKGKN